MTPRLEKDLEEFLRQVVWKMEGVEPKFQWDGTWVYPPIGKVLATVGLDDIRVYIARRQNTVAQYIVNCPIMDLCLVAEQDTGLRFSRQWWEQPTLNILRIRAGHAAAEGREDTGTEESEGEGE